MTTLANKNNPSGIDIKSNANKDNNIGFTNVANIIASGIGNNITATDSINDVMQINQYK